MERVKLPTCLPPLEEINIMPLSKLLLAQRTPSILTPVKRARFFEHTDEDTHPLSPPRIKRRRKNYDTTVPPQGSHFPH